MGHIKFRELPIFMDNRPGPLILLTEVTILDSKQYLVDNKLNQICFSI